MNYISFRGAACIILALIIAFWIGPKIIRRLQAKQIGETIRDLGLEGQLAKKGTPTMGGLIILLSILIPVLLLGRMRNIYLLLMIGTTIWLGFLGFMDDYIKEQRIVKKDKENVYFLTTNVDLIAFCKNRHPDASYMISTSKVILELWMHNAQPAKVSASALTETMARCLDLHRSKVRSKLHDVAKFFNRNKEDIAPEVYNEFLRLLYRRARNVVAAVDQVPEGESKAFAQKLQEAIRKDKSHYEAVNSEINREKESLKDIMHQQEEDLAFLAKESGQKSQEIDILKEKNDKLVDQKKKLASDLEGAKKDLNSVKEEKEKLEKEKEKSDRLNNLYTDRDKLTEKFVHLKATLEPLEKERCDCYKYHTPSVLMIIGIVFIAIFGVLVVLNITRTLTIDSWELYITLVPLGGILIATSLALNSEDRKKRLKEDAYAKWDRNHPNYLQLKAKKEEIEEEIKVTNREINNTLSK